MIPVRILPFPGTRPDSNIFWYSHSFYQFFNTRTDSTFSRYSPGSYHFSVLTQIRPFSSTHRDIFSTLARILPVPGADSNSAIFRHSHRFDPFSVLAETVFRDSYEFYLFPVLIRTLPFFGTYTYSTLFWYSPGQFFDSHRDSNFSRYSHRFDHFSILAETVF